MKKKIILLNLLLLSSINLFGMNPKRKELPQEKVPPAKRHKRENVYKLLPLNANAATATAIIVPQIYYGGRPFVKKKGGTENQYIQGELIDLSEIDPIKQDTFVHLIKEKHKEGLPYIFAALLMQNNQTKLLIRRYQDAEMLVNWMFDTSNFTILPDKYKNVVTQNSIAAPVLFFIWYPGEKSVQLLCSSHDLKYKEHERAKHLLRVNAGKGTVNDFFLLGQDFASDKKYDLAITYYKMAAKMGDAQSLWELGLLYENQKNYSLAEHYWIEAAQKGYAEAVLDLMYLFAENKTTQVTRQELINYYDNVKDKRVDINDYQIEFSDRWDKIKDAFFEELLEKDPVELY